MKPRETLILPLLAVLGLAMPLRADWRVCVDPRTGAPAWTDAEPCNELVQFTYRCDAVMRLPHCAPPASFTIPNPAVPPFLRVPVTYGGEIVRGGERCWQWNYAAGKVLYVSAQFFVPPPPTMSLRSSETSIMAQGERILAEAEQVTVDIRQVIDIVELTDPTGFKHKSPDYLFVAARLPANTSKVIVERGYSMAVSRPVWIRASGPDRWSVIPIPADNLIRPSDQQFDVLLPSGAPYVGAVLYSNLPTATCVELRIDCDGGGIKRRPVRSSVLALQVEATHLESLQAVAAAAVTAPQATIAVSWTRTTREDPNPKTGGKTVISPSSYVFNNELITIKCVSGTQEWTRTKRVTGTLADVPVMCILPMSEVMAAWIVRADGTKINLDSPTALPVDTTGQPVGVR